MKERVLIMKKKTCVAMLLAGGQGSRLGVLTKKVAKPAVPYGGKYRIIDFPLSNCTNSGIDTVGVLTQYMPLELNSYIGSGAPWDLDLSTGGVFVLPPYQTGKTGDWYRGTANAIYQNMAFIEQYDPDYVLILSGDHIYKMDYNAMLQYHIRKGADATIAVRPVPWEEASRFGIMNTDADDNIVEFEEKPKQPKSNKASMGIYIFSWAKLRAYLTADSSAFSPAQSSRRASAGTRSPASSWIRSPGTNRAASMRRSWRSRMTRAWGALICRRASRARWALDSWEREMPALTRTMTRMMTASSQSRPRLERRERAAAASRTSTMGSLTWFRKRSAQEGWGGCFS